MNKRLNIYLLVTLALCLFVTKASAYNVVDEIVGFMLDKRQANSTSTTTTITSTTTTPSSTSTTTTPTSSTTSITSRSTATSTTTRGSSSSSTRDDDSSTTSSSTTLTTVTTTRAVTTVTLTLEGGRVTTSTGFTSELVTPTHSPQNTDTSGNGGISTGTRNTIIGVVVGVGGVIMIGALAIVAYRLRKRKASAAGSGYPEDLGPTGSPSTGASSRPQDAFKATLDQYHKPQGTVNPSANF